MAAGPYNPPKGAGYGGETTQGATGGAKGRGQGRGRGGVQATLFQRQRQPQGHPCHRRRARRPARLLPLGADHSLVGLLRLPDQHLSLNLLFASLYWLDPGGVANTRPHAFIDNFFFSVETISTIGYGVMTPKSLYANVVMTAEAFTGLGMVAIATGLIFSRVSRPTARVLFSRIAVITPFNGVPALMFRAANQRGNQILEAEASVNLFGEVITVEGHNMRRFQPLELVRARQPMFALSWTLMHFIDETSPLFGATADSLQADSAAIVVALSGVDEIFAQRIYARHSYLPDEIIW